jgi:acetylornithine/succinyldiaminopimelate/putrescine aminotransferase
VWDVDGKEYYDFVSGISSVNQGHSHPKILEAFVEQSETLAITSRAVHNSKFGDVIPLNLSYTMTTEPLITTVLYQLVCKIHH